MDVKRLLNPASLVGLALSVFFAVSEKWTVPEFAWSTWLAGLVFSYASIVSWALHVLFTAREDKPLFERRLPFLTALTPGVFLLILIPLMLLGAYIAFRVYTFLFGFYGIFLSVFASMPPDDLFGPDGFINSDFYTPLAELLRMFWPMAVGTLIANAGIFLNHEIWKQVFMPFKAEMLRIHILTLAVPFLSLGAWILFKDDYQPVTVVLLLVIFYLLPGKEKLVQQSQPPELPNLGVS